MPTPNRGSKQRRTYDVLEEILALVKLKRSHLEMYDVYDF